MLYQDHEIAPVDQSRIPRFSFSSKQLPKASQFAAWRELVSPLVELRVPGGTDDAFDAEETTWDLGSVALASSRIPPVAFMRTTAHLRGDAIDHWVLTCVRDGTDRTISSRRVNTALPGVVIVNSLRAPFHGTMAHTDALHLFVPRDFCRGAAAALDAADNTSLTTGLGRLLADYLGDLERRLPAMTAEELPGVLEATRAMITACVQPGTDSLLEARKPIEVTLLERARRIVQSNLLSPTFGADDLCRELGVSRSRLYRLFEPLGGVVHYIRLRRLLEVHAALSNPDDSRRIVYIAAEHGFVDAAEFSRAFKREFGYRPTDARNHTGRGYVHRRADAPIASGRVGFCDLLRRLH